MRDGGRQYMLGSYLIRPHVDAPQFARPEEGAKYFEQVMSEMQSGHGNTSKEAYNLIRQASLSSFWFFTRFILGHSGPYTKLDDPISIDMCNFRSCDAWERPGARAAAFIPRGFFKSTVFTHGGDTWDLLRDPDERILIANAIDGKAAEFLHLVERNFDSNEMMAYFFPEYIDKKKGTINDKFMILPNRTRNYVEPSIRSIGMTGAAEGGHYTYINIDDLVGIDGLNEEKSSTVVMDTAKRWMNTNLAALRVDNTSRIGIVATRYAIDDCYSRVYESCRSVTGWSRGDLQPQKGGEWDVYYRLVKEGDHYLRPDIMDEVGLARLLKDDYWTAMTQYFNEPTKAGLAEFQKEDVRFCKLGWDEKEQEYWIVKERDANWDPDDEVETEVRLGSCSVMMSTDFAATESGITAKTNRTSIGVWAKDSKGNCYRVWSRVGFFSIYQTMDYIFEGHRIFKGVIGGTYIETNAFQKIVKIMLATEQRTRGEWINPIPVNVAGDKFARIRSALGPKLTRRQIWVTPEAGVEFLEEIRMFPMNKSRVDVLDESEKSLTFIPAPMTAEEREHYEEDEAEWDRSASLSATGY